MFTHTVSVRSQQIGAELRRLREERTTMPAAAAAQRLDVSPSKMSRIESGLMRQKVEEVAALLALYNVTGEERTKLLDLAREVNQSGWWRKLGVSLYERIHTLATLESKAIGLTNYESELIPGLLQTAPYMQALMKEMGNLENDEVNRRIAVRIQRQEILRKPRPPHLLAIINENAFWQGVGGPEVMRGQLVYLLEPARGSHVTIRVIPKWIGGHPGMDGAFLRLRFAERTDVVMEGGFKW